MSKAIARLGGSGLDEKDAAALTTFLRSQKDAMSPLVKKVPAKLVTQGAELFERTGCVACHDPDNDFSDGQIHKFRGDLVRTPSLRGVGMSAPYYHDGSAATLAALLSAHEKDNPMAVGNKLKRAELGVLEAYLKTL